MTQYEYKITGIFTEAQILAATEDNWHPVMKIDLVDTSITSGVRILFKRELPNPYATITNRGPK